jgi:site-specific recombinase XerD
VKRFLAFLSEEEVNPEEITSAVARRYLAYLRETPGAAGRARTARTVYAYRTAATAFCRYLVGERILAHEPFAQLRPTRVPKTVPAGVVKPAELALVLGALASWDDRTIPTHHRARRFIAQVVAELQYSCGLRISEVAALTEADLLLERNLIHVRGGKGGRDRFAYVGHYAADLLRLYLEHREALLSGIHDPDDPRLFACGYDALGHSQNGHLKRVEVKTGVKMRSHGFRHALGYHLLRNGCPLRVIQEILGHVLIKDTEVYTRLDIEDVKTAVDRYHPLGPVA